MASRAMMPTGEGRVCTSTTSALSPCPRVTWLVGLASVMARAGKTRARARAGARKIVLDMGVLLVVVRGRSDQLSGGATGRAWFGALGSSSRKRARYGGADARRRRRPGGRSTRVDVDRGGALPGTGGLQRHRAIRLCARPPGDADRSSLDVHAGGLGQHRE